MCHALITVIMVPDSRLASFSRMVVDEVADRLVIIENQLFISRVGINGYLTCD